MSINFHFFLTIQYTLYIISNPHYGGTIVKNDINGEGALVI